MPYEHRQTSYVVFGSAMLTAAVILAIVAVTGSAGALAIVAAITVLLIVLGVLFSELAVTVTDADVAVAFRWGWPKRTIDLGEVAAVRQVRNQWYQGWGVRKIRYGWMYNVAGFDAVELELRTGKVFRIGTDEPEPLARALSAQLTPTS